MTKYYSKFWVYGYTLNSSLKDSIYANSPKILKQTTLQAQTRIHLR